MSQQENSRVGHLWDSIYSSHSANLEQCDIYLHRRHRKFMILTGEMKHSNSVPAFVSKLWALVEAESTNELICWSQVSVLCRIQMI